MNYRSFINKLLGRGYGPSRVEAIDYSDSSLEEVRDPEKIYDDLKRISQNNLDNAILFLNHRFNCSVKGLDIESSESRMNFSRSNLQDVVRDPDLIIPIAEAVDVDDLIEAAAFNLESHGEFDINAQIKNLEEKQIQEEEKNRILKAEQESIKEGRFKNFEFMNGIDDEDKFVRSLTDAGVRCALLLTDTFYTRDTDFYKKIVKIFNDNNISFVEFTNIQPELDRKLIFRIYEFANDHDVNSLVAIGSMSTVDLSKLLLSKLLKPNIVNLHKTRAFEPSLAANYSIFSIPTFVVPDPFVNSRSSIRNNLLAPNLNFFGNTLYLKNEIDDADGVFYCTDVFNTLSRDKMIETLHETFFRLIFCYFDLAVTDDLLDQIVENIKKVERLLESLIISGKFENYERKALMEIISFTMDGRIIVDTPEFWILYKLEGALSSLVNSKKSDGLALFMPIFLEVMSERSGEFSRRAISLSQKLYGAYSVEGGVLNLMMHIKKYRLPISLLEIDQVKKVNYRFLYTLMKKAMIGSRFGSLSKAIVKNLAVL